MCGRVGAREGMDETPKFNYEGNFSGCYCC
jgi:hypothetical protein